MEVCEKIGLICLDEIENYERSKIIPVDRNISVTYVSYATFVFS